MTTVLVSSAGRRVELIRCFREAGQNLGIGVRVVAVDANPEMSAACSLADQSYAVRPCSAPGYLEDLFEICRKEKVDLLVPTIDPELQVLSDNAARFSKAGVRVVVSEPEVIRMARSKIATHRWLIANGLPSPRAVSYTDFIREPKSLAWPIIAKPDGGSSSVGIRIFHSPAELDAFEPGEESYIVQEFWKGREYTVNLFFDCRGEVRCIVPHLRIEVRSGEVNKGLTERNEDILSLARTLGGRLDGAIGPVCFQAIQTQEGAYAIFEINARFGGGYPLTHHAGGRFTQWLVEESLGHTPAYNDDWTHNLAMLRYDMSVFKVLP